MSSSLFFSGSTLGLSSFLVMAQILVIPPLLNRVVVVVILVVVLKVEAIAVIINSSTNCIWSRRNASGNILRTQTTLNKSWLGILC